jgi:plastocyanin
MAINTKLGFYVKRSMMRSSIWYILYVLALVFCVQLFNGCDSPDASSSMTQGFSSSPGADISTCSGIEYRVMILASSFEPTQTEIKVGDTVTWLNQCDDTYIITSIYHYQDEDDVSHIFLAETWDSGDILPGASYSRTFEYAGTFEYIRLPITIRTPLDQYFEFTAQAALGVVIVR